MELATGGGSNASAFGGTGNGVAEEREKGAGREGEWRVFGSLIEVCSSLNRLGKWGREGEKGGGMAGAGACAVRGGLAMCGGAAGHG